MSSDTKAAVSGTVAPDDELAEIMNEINSIQESISRVEPVVSAEVGAGGGEPVAESNGFVSDDLKDFRGNQGDASLEETLGTLPETEASSGGGILEQAISSAPTQEPIAEVESLIAAEMAAEASRMTHQLETEARFATKEASMPESNDRSKAADGNLTLVLNGSMTLKLKYEFSGQEVTVSFSGEALMVQLADGTEFKVPVGNRPKLRIA